VPGNTALIQAGSCKNELRRSFKTGSSRLFETPLRTTGIGETRPRKARGGSESVRSFHTGSGRCSKIERTEAGSRKNQGQPGANDTESRITRSGGGNGSRKPFTSWPPKTSSDRTMYCETAPVKAEASKDVPRLRSSSGWPNPGSISVSARSMPKSERNPRRETPRNPKASVCTSEIERREAMSREGGTVPR
jgi:hypothetical protein